MLSFMLEHIDTVLFAGTYYIMIRGMRYYRKEHKVMKGDWLHTTDQYHKLIHHYNTLANEHTALKAQRKPEDLTIMQFNLPEK